MKERRFHPGFRAAKQGYFHRSRSFNSNSRKFPAL
jgi:hypothetical protein